MAACVTLAINSRACIHLLATAGTCGAAGHCVCSGLATTQTIKSGISSLAIRQSHSHSGGLYILHCKSYGFLPIHFVITQEVSAASLTCHCWDLWDFLAAQELQACHWMEVLFRQARQYFALSPAVRVNYI